MYINCWSRVWAHPRYIFYFILMITDIAVCHYRPQNYVLTQMELCNRSIKKIFSFQKSHLS